MEQSEQELRVLIIVERIEGKIDRMNDRIKLTEERVTDLLDIVTGSKRGAQTGLIMRVSDLEKRADQLEETNGKIASMEKKLDKVIQMQLDHPPLLYLLRFKTRKTLMWIVIIFALLSIWWLSGIRQPILEFFGLPVF